MKKETPLVCLPTTEASNLHTAYYGTSKELMYVSIEPFIQVDKETYKSHFLYALSSEPIKEGDWVIVFDKGREWLHKTSHKDAIGWIMFGEFSFDQMAEYKKIIGTNNPELLDKELSINQIPSTAESVLGSMCSKAFKLPLSLIEHYAKYQPKSVMLEYEYNHDDSVSFPKTIEGKEILKLTSSGEVIWSPVDRIEQSIEAMGFSVSS